MIRSALRYGMRQGLDRGLVEGNSVWFVVGAASLLATLAGRAMRRQPELVFFSSLPAGETFEITHEARS
jgi:hypothetical protein